MIIFTAKVLQVKNDKDGTTRTGQGTFFRSRHAPPTPTSDDIMQESATKKQTKNDVGRLELTSEAFLGGELRALALLTKAMLVSGIGWVANEWVWAAK